MKMMWSSYVCFVPAQRIYLQSNRTILIRTHPQISPDNISVRHVLENFGRRRAFEWDAWKLKNEQLFNVPDLLSEALHSLTSPSR